MKLLYFLANTFISTFGITQPTQKARKQAAFFILTLLILVVMAAASAAFMLHSVMQ